MTGILIVSFLMSPISGLELREDSREEFIRLKDGFLNEGHARIFALIVTSCILRFKVDVKANPSVFKKLN